MCFLNSNCIDNPSLKCSVDDRTDNCSVIFKKLEKVGEPKIINEKKVQLLKSKYCKNCDFWDNNDCTFTTYPRTCMGGEYGVYVEIKQNKEDMEDLDKIKVRDYTKVEELNVMEENKLNLKPFDIQKAREGKPVCTRDGRNARVLCYDFKQNEEYPILVAVENKDGKECALLYSNDGISEMYKSSNNELAMFPEKKEGWVNIYNRYSAELTSDGYFYFTKEEALSNIENDGTYVKTIKMSWEG